jgi:hypothetical protein
MGAQPMSAQDWPPVEGMRALCLVALFVVSDRCAVWNATEGCYRVCYFVLERFRMPESSDTSEDGGPST